MSCLDVLVILVVSVIALFLVGCKSFFLFAMVHLEVWLL